MTTTHNPTTPLELAHHVTREFDAASWRRLHALTEDGANVVAEALNQLQILENVLLTPELDNDDVLLQARAMADCGHRLRQVALTLGLVKRASGSYLVAGDVFTDADSAIFACRHFLEHLEGGSK